MDENNDSDLRLFWKFEINEYGMNITKRQIRNSERLTNSAGIHTGSDYTTSTREGKNPCKLLTHLLLHAALGISVMAWNIFVFRSFWLPYKANAVTPQ